MKCHGEAAGEAKHKDLIALLCKDIINGYTIQFAICHSAAYRRVSWVQLLIFQHKGKYKVIPLQARCGPEGG